MDSKDPDFVSLLQRPLNGIQGLIHTSPSSIVAYGIALLILIVFLVSQNGTKIKAFDMDGMPMKELNISVTMNGLTISGASNATVLQPHHVSKRGEQLAYDEPYILRNGRQSEVVIHTAEHVREFLRKDSKDHYKPADLHFGDYFYLLLGQCVGALSGEPWRTVRRYFDPAYTHDASITLIPSFQAEIVKWLTTLKNDALRSGVGRFVLNAPAACKVLPLRAIPQSFYGEAFDDDQYAELLRISKTQGQALIYAVTGRWQMYRWFNMLPTPSRRLLDLYNRDWKAFNLGILEIARKKGLSIPAEHVFKGVQPDDSISMEHYLQTIDEMIFANIDITGNIIAFMLDRLAKHPEFQGKLYEEIMAQKSDEKFNLSSYVSRQTTLLHYLCLETVRLRPAVWFSAPECTTVDKVIGRYKIPAQTPIVIDVRRLNTNALTWGPDGAEFRPERFAKLSPNEYRYGYIRFGVSSKCLGKHMADVLMKVAVITILEQYKIEPVEMNIGVKEGDLAFVKRIR